MGRIGVAEELAVVANACEHSHIRMQQKRGIAWPNWVAVSFEGNTVDSEVGEWVGLLDCRVHWPFKGIYELSKLPPPPTESNFASDNRHLKPYILIRMVFFAGHRFPYIALRNEVELDRLSFYVSHMFPTAPV